MTDLSPYRAGKIPERLARWLEELRAIVNRKPDQVTGAGSPEGVVFARAGARYFNTTGSSGTLLYVKTTAASSNTGWVAYG